MDESQKPGYSLPSVRPEFPESHGSFGREKCMKGTAGCQVIDLSTHLCTSDLAVRSTDADIRSARKILDELTASFSKKVLPGLLRALAADEETMLECTFGGIVFFSIRHPDHHRITLGYQDERGHLHTYVGLRLGPNDLCTIVAVQGALPELEELLQSFIKEWEADPKGRECFNPWRPEFFS